MQRAGTDTHDRSSALVESRCRRDSQWLERSKWADQSGNGNNAIQLFSERQPLLLRNVLNGKPVIRFDGSDDRLGLTGSKLMSQISLFLTLKIDSGAMGYSPIVLGDIDAAGRVWGVIMQSIYTGYSPDTINIFIGFNSYVRASALNCSAFGLWHNISVVTNGVMWNTTLRADGVDAEISLDAPNMLLSVSIGNSSGTGFGGIGGAKCDIAEVILYDTVLSDSLRRSVELYLAAKYGLPQMAESGK